MYNISNIRRRLLPRTLFGRSLMILLMPILLLQGIVAFTFFDRHWDTMTEKLVNSLAGEIDLIVDTLEEAKSEKEISKIIEDATASLDFMVSVERKTLSGEPYSHVRRLQSFSIDDKLKHALDMKLREPFVVSGSAAQDRWFEVRVQLKDGRMARFVCQDKRVMSPTTYIFILWMIGSSILLFGIAVVFMRNQIRPIRRLAIAAEKFGKGQDVPNFRVEGASEVRQASRAFVEMKERLKRQIEQRTAMLAGVSHDLRTPLTRMKLQLAMARNSAEIENLRHDIEEMEKMIEAYLTFAKGENNEPAEMIDLKTILDRIITNAKRQGYAVQDTQEENLTLRVRPIGVERAIANVVSNACKYAKQVWLNAYRRTDCIEITVDDDGPGIPMELREEVFKPFTRVEKSRNKKTGGIGLGLSIAQDIVHGHGGEIFLEDSNRGGLRVVIKLPL